MGAVDAMGGIATYINTFHATWSEFVISNMNCHMLQFNDEYIVMQRYAAATDGAAHMGQEDVTEETAVALACNSLAPRDVRTKAFLEARTEELAAVAVRNRGLARQNALLARWASKLGMRSDVAAVAERAAEVLRKEVSAAYGGDVLEALDAIHTE